VNGVLHISRGAGDLKYGSTKPFSIRGSRLRGEESIVVKLISRGNEVFVASTALENILATENPRGSVVLAYGQHLWRSEAKCQQEAVCICREKSQRTRLGNVTGRNPGDISTRNQGWHVRKRQCFTPDRRDCRQVRSIP
jgi:hypothetical protein